jgi:hypothetical protein
MGAPAKNSVLESPGCGDIESETPFDGASSRRRLESAFMFA